jgi:hypothetical protein
MKLLSSRTILLHPVLVDILCICVQLHQLMSNATVQISKFIQAITSCGGHSTADVFTQHYDQHSLAISLSTPVAMGGGPSSPSLSGTNGQAVLLQGAL